MGHKGIVHSKVYEENTLLSQSVYFLLALLSPPRVDKEGLTRPMNLTQSTTQKGLVEEKEHLALQNPFLYELPFLINNFVIIIIREKKNCWKNNRVFCSVDNTHCLEGAYRHTYTRMHNPT